VPVIKLAWPKLSTDVSEGAVSILKDSDKLSNPDTEMSCPHVWFARDIVLKWPSDCDHTVQHYTLTACAWNY